ncbi:PAS-domain containing protein [Pseudoxanthomonas sp. PXM04]|uniref:hybrid sensor histidine kinase/response regulator n=1 Tax=Pseudoxanthomonas sp. PXM04 TaxID=2769297 RepID=UPI00177C9AA3|nr:PAS-domain containing protein [Pseudoxanthomonas sp. PXM04]MBD9378640.1 PAS-domain containing protein [Pseudoxanthomonas sp. PXM04]
MPFLRTPRRRTGLFLLLAVVAIAIATLSLLAMRQLERRSLLGDAAQAREQLRLHGDALQSLIERHRVLPAVLALDPDIRAALAHGNVDAADSERLSRKLERVNGAAATSTLTLLDRDGLALAASNWRMADASNVGNRYHFRPYFQQAMREGSGTFYAEGVTTAVPGYFLSEAVRDEAGRPIGVVVVKVVLRPLERTWAEAPEIVFVTDANGVIFLSSRTGWRYRVLHALTPAARERLARTRQYGQIPRLPLEYRITADLGQQVHRARLPDAGDVIWVSQPLPRQGWTLNLLRSTHDSVAAARTMAAAVAAGLLVLALLGFVLWQRRRLAQLRERSRVELERLVEHHAQELRSAQDGLVQAAHAADYGESPSLQHLPQGVCVVDAQLNLVAWNRRYIELFRFPPGFIQVGRPIADVFRYNANRGLLGPGPIDEAIERRLNHLRSGKPHMHERERGDGSVIEIRGNPLPDGGFVTSYADITAYKNAARDLRSLADTLSRRIDERTRDLADAKREAEDANRSKTRFVAAAVHDLLQPLNAARMFLSALRGRLPDAGARDIAENIDNALAAQDGILNSLLDISRLESGALETHVRDFALDPLLATLAREFGILAAARGLRLERVATSAVVRSDEALLRRILQNFLSNAIRYTPRGRIVLGCRRQGDQVRIEVHDTGPGIPEARQQEIFEEFRRLDGDGEERGAGLGLAIVDRIARLLGHRIGLRSRLGNGSVFSIRVPRGVSAAAPATEDGPGAEDASTATEEAATDSLLAGCRVWCIDDDARVIRATRLLLERWGCRVELAGGVEQALAAARADDVPDLLLLDVRLGDDVTGPELFGQLARRWQREPAVLLFTAEQDEALRALARERNWGFLSKQARTSALRSLMTHLYQRSR